jgi:hypothetical protein
MTVRGIKGMIVLKTALLVLLEVTLYASLGNANFTLPGMFMAFFYSSYFGLPIVVLRYATIHSLFAKQAVQLWSSGFWKSFSLFIAPCLLWVTCGLTSSSDNWANSWLPLSLLGYLAGELLAFLLILRPRLVRH